MLHSDVPVARTRICTTRFCSPQPEPQRGSRSPGFKRRLLARSGSLKHEGSASQLTRQARRSGRKSLLQILDVASGPCWHLNSKTNCDLEGFYEKGIDSPWHLRIGERESIRLRSQYRSRILEKQNSLQMSQVFFGIAHSSFARFAFQGFYMRDHGTRQRYRLSSPPVNARANQEPTRYAEDAQAITQTFNKFWSRSSEAVSARQRCSQCHHDTLRSRRSEARPR